MRIDRNWVSAPGNQHRGFGSQRVAAVSLPCVAQRCARRQNATQFSAPALCVQWRRGWHNTQLCSYRLVTEAGPGRPRELPGCISVLLCQRVTRFSKEPRESVVWGRWDTAFRHCVPHHARAAEPRARQAVVPFHLRAVAGVSASHGSIGRVQGAGVHLAACVSQKASVRASAGAEVHRNGDASALSA